MSAEKAPGASDLAPESARREMGERQRLTAAAVPDSAQRSALMLAAHVLDGEDENPEAGANEEAAMRFSNARRFLEGEHNRLMEVKVRLEHDRLSEESQRRSTSELSGTDEHLADVASETAEREAELSLLAMVDDELESIHAAITRVEAGTYGTCVACGRPIGDARLAAVPATAYCIHDQGAIEREHAITEDHGCARDIEREAIAHLDLLPQDDDVVTLGAEEAAMTDEPG